MGDFGNNPTPTTQNCDQVRDCFEPPEEPSIVGPEYPRHGQSPSGHQ